MAHELRTPLTNIRSWLEAAEDALAPPVSEPELTAALLREALQLQHIVDDLQVDSERSVRYLCAGSGPALVLLHTIRTQLEYFADVIPILARNYTVYAVDLPGHGHSSKPNGVRCSTTSPTCGGVSSTRCASSTSVT